MWRGLYTAATGMVSEMNRTDTITNNLANAATAGYKRDRAVNREFEPMLIRRIDDGDPNDNITRFKSFVVGDQLPVVGMLGLGSYTSEIATDHAQGSIQTTGNPLDVAISGEGYLAVQTPAGVRYTRDGSLRRSFDGTLVNSRGEAVLNGQNRPIVLPEGATRISIGSRGEIFANEVADAPSELLDTMQFVQFDDRRAVLKEGDNHYVPQQGARPRQATGTIEQGCLEMSNAIVVSEMVDLINSHRVYEANSKAVTTQDTMLDKSVNEVGRQ